jgi:hypothetical protein
VAVTKVNNNVELIVPATLKIIITLMIRKIIPIMTDTNELILCFTTSVLFSASNFGYFKLIMIPIKCDTKGISTDNINNNIDSMMLILNLIINTIVPIINTGVVIIKLEYTFDINIVLTLTGNDFNILMLLPSKLITELVIDVIKAVTVIKISITKDKLFIIKSLDIFIPFGSVSPTSRLSNLIDIITTPRINRTSPNPELTINTGV